MKQQKSQIFPTMKVTCYTTLYRLRKLNKYVVCIPMYGFQKDFGLYLSLRRCRANATLGITCSIRSLAISGPGHTRGGGGGGGEGRERGEGEGERGGQRGRERERGLMGRNGGDRVQRKVREEE